MNIPDHIIQSSYSKDELVLPYIKALDLLIYLKNKDISILGWEGWVLYPDNSLGHSQLHQGTTDISDLPHLTAISLASSTIMQAHKMWKTKPEAKDGELLFCITLST